MLRLLLQEKDLSLVNVNLPEKPRGLRWTRQAVQQYDGEVVPGKDPMKRPIYWFTVRPLKGEAEGTDRWAFAQRLVSITPLRLDLTDEKDLARVLALDSPQAPAKSCRQPPARVEKKRRERKPPEPNQAFLFSRRHNPGADIRLPEEAFPVLRLPYGFQRAWLA